MDTTNFEIEAVSIKTEPDIAYYSEYDKCDDDDDELENQIESHNKEDPSDESKNNNNGIEDRPESPAWTRSTRRDKIRMKKIIPEDQRVILDDGDLPYLVDYSEEGKPFRCRNCNEHCARLSTLMQHIHRKHVGVEVPRGENIAFRCQDCNKTFPKHGPFIRHRMGHMDPANQNPYSCTLCDKAFEFKYMVKRHMISSHSAATPHYCEHCNRYFGQKSHLERHMSKHSVPKEYKCKECELKFKNKFLLECHFRNHKKERPYKCHLCRKMYYFQFHLETHLKAHFKKGGLQCEICERFFSTRGNLQRHYATHEQKPGINTGMVCKICNTWHKNRHLLLKHIKKNHIEKDGMPWGDFGYMGENSTYDENDPIGLNEFKTISKESTNISSQFMNKEEMCHIDQADEIKSPVEYDSGNKIDDNVTTNCENNGPENKFNIKTELSDNGEVENSELNEATFINSQISEQRKAETVPLLDVKHENKIIPMNNEPEEGIKIDQVAIAQFLDEVEKPHRCHICPKAFKFRSKLKMHIGVHNVDRPYQCEICSVSFNQERYLTRHMMLHGNKNLCCKLCPKKFTLVKSLKRHISTHDGVKPYACSRCDKSFAYQRSLDIHNRVHSGIKPYVCNYCERAFTQKSGLHSHIAVHTDNRPFTCDHCKKCFTAKNQLRRHIVRIHIQLKPFKCKKCGIRFTELNLLKRHLGTVHSEGKAANCAACGRTYRNRVRLAMHLDRSIRCQNKHMEKNGM